MTWLEKSHSKTQRPSIIFIDEIDSLCSTRSEGENDAARRVKTEFLVQMQGVGHNDNGILILAATNIPWGLDSAVRRRFERRIYIPLPDLHAKARIIPLSLGTTPHTLTNQDYNDIAMQCHMYSGSDMNVLVRQAMMECIKTLQLATHFKYIEGPDPDNLNCTVPNRIIPCSPGDPDGFECTLFDIQDPNLVLALPVTAMDFHKALKFCQTVGKSRRYTTTYHFHGAVWSGGVNITAVSIANQSIRYQWARLVC